MFGLTPTDWEIVKTTCIDPLKKVGAKVWIYGSRARGDHKKFSDVDILYQGTPGPLIHLIKEAAEESRLTVKIDLVSIDDLAESYRSNILRDRREV